MEIAEPETLNAKQTAMIKSHLNMVFFHDIDPSYPADQQQVLNELHSGVKTDQEKLQDDILESVKTKDHKNPLMRC
jgi:hypothetical protein